MLRTKLRMAAVILMLVSFVFGTVSPALAAGIQKVSYTPMCTTNGFAGNFLGIDWIVYNTDSRYAYVITKGIVGSLVFGENACYSSSSLKTFVNDYENNTLKEYGSTSQSTSLTWYDISGGGGTMAKGLIANHSMTDISPSVTTDKLYILSDTEAQQGYFATKSNRVSSSSSWWLRSPNTLAAYAWLVGDNGDIYISYVNNKIGVRPALQIDLKSPLFSYPLFKTAAVGGKSCVTAGQGFGLPATTPTAWKLTVADDNVTRPSGVRVEQEPTGGGVNNMVASASIGATVNLHGSITSFFGDPPTIIYTNKGDGQYISAIVSDTSGNYTNYAKISDEESNTSGVTLPFGNLADGAYFLDVFSETPKGDNEVDYVSNLVTVGQIKKGNQPTTKDTLRTTQKDKAVTANINGDFELAFENDTYQTSVEVDSSESGKITAAATDGTTLAGKITVGSSATLTTTNAFTFTNAANTINGELTGDALTIGDGKTTVTDTGSIANAVTVSGGTLEANAAGLKAAVTNNATVNLTGGTLASGKTITGTGTTNVNGVVTTSALVSTTNYTVGASGNLTTDAQYIGSDINNGGIVNLTTGTLNKKISGSGTLNINGAVSSSAGNIAGNTNTIASDVMLTLTEGTLAKTVGGDGNVAIGGSVSSSAANFTNTGTLSVSASKTLTLTGDRLEKAISGDGTVKFTAGELAANVTTNTLDFAGEVTANASCIKATTTNKVSSGTLTLASGTLDKDITNNGTLNVTNAAVSADATVTNNGTLTLNGTGTISGAVVNNAGGTYTVTAGTQSGAVTNKALLAVDGGKLTGGVTNTGTINASVITALQSAVTNTNGTLNLNGAGALNSAAVITAGNVNVNANVDAAAANFAGGMKLAIGSGLQLALSGTGTLGSGIALQGTPGTSNGILKNTGTLTAETALNYRTVNEGTLAVSASNVKNAVNNAGGTLNLATGDMRASQYAVISGGTVNVNGEVKAAQANFSTADKVANLNIAAAGTLNLVSSEDAASKIDQIQLSGNFTAVSGAEIGLDVDLSGFSNPDDGIENAKDVAAGKFDSIKAAGASGVLNLGSVNVLGVPAAADMKLGAYGYLKVIDTTAANTVTFDTSVTVTSEGARYDFSQAKDSGGNNKNGYLQVQKQNGYTLYETVTKTHGDADTYDLGKVKTYAIINGTWTADGATGAYDKIVEGGTGTATGTLGTLGARTGDPNEFTIQANGYDYKVGSSQTVTGITVGSGTLSLVNAKEISGWSSYVADNAGTFNLSGRTGTNVTTLKSEIKGTGTTNLKGNVVVDGAGKITQGTLNVATGAALNADADKLVVSTKLDNLGTLTLADGTLATAANGITGTGTTIINGDVITANAITQGALTTANGKSLNMTGSGDLTVTSAVVNKGSLVIDAGKLKSNVNSDENTDEVILNAGTLADAYTIKNGKITANGAVSANVNSLQSKGGIATGAAGLTLTGNGSLYDNIGGDDGKTVIAGTINGNDKTITQDKLEITGSLTTKADKLAIASEIANSGTLTLAGGTLAMAANGITGTGTTVIDGAVATTNAIMQGALTIADGKSLSMTGSGDLTVSGGVTNKGTLTVGAAKLKSNVTNNGTANVTAGTFGADYKITGGDVNLTDATFSNANLAGTVNLHSDEAANAKYYFNVTGVDGNSVTMEKITVSGAATGKLSLGTATFTGGSVLNASDWEVGTTADVQYITGGSGNTIEATGVTAFDEDEYRYTFKQKKTNGVFTAADSTWLTVTKSYAYKLWEVVRGVKGSDLSDYVLTGNYDINAEAPTADPTDELGTLVTSAREDNSFTIVGNGYDFKDTAGTHKGITVGTDGNLTLSEISEISGWNTYAVSNAGTFNLDGRTGDKVTTLKSEIKGTGTTNLKGNVVVDAGGRITQGALTLAVGTVLNSSADSLAITSGTTNCGTINLDAGTLTSAVTGGILNFVGNVNSNADYVKGTTNNVTADTTLTLTGGALVNAVTGDGNVAIDGEVSSNLANLGNSGTLSVTGGTLTLTDGTLTKEVTNDGTVKFDGAVLGGKHVTAGTLEFARDYEINADYLAADVNVVDDTAALTLTAGTLAKGITNNGSVTAQSGVAINSTITGGEAASAELKEGAVFGNSGKISGGSVTLGKDVVFSAVSGEANLEGLKQLTANEALYIFDVTLGNGTSDSPYVKTTMLDTDKADGTINLKRATFTADCVTAGDWLAETKQMQYLSNETIGAGSNLTINKRIVGSNDGYRYVFTQGRETPGDVTTAKKTGWIDVYKEVGYTLKEMVNGSRGESGEDNEFTLQSDDSTSVTENLEGLNNDNREDFTIRGKNTAGDNYTLYGNDKGGIVVADPANFGGKAGDTLNLEDIKLNNFKTVVTNKEGGIVNLNNVVFEETGTMDIVNDGTLTLSGTNEFDKGISGNGTIKTQADYVLKGQGKDATTIAAKTLTGAGNLAVENVTLEIGEGLSEIAGTLALDGTALVKGAGADKTAVITNALTPAETLNVSDITISAANAVTVADGAVYTGNGKDNAVIIADAFNGAGSATLKDVTMGALNGVNAAGTLTLDGAYLASGAETALGGLVSADGTLKGSYGVTDSITVSSALNLDGNTAATTDKLVITAADGLLKGIKEETETDFLNAGTMTAAGNVTIEDLKLTVSGDVDVEGDLTVTDAEVNVGGDLDVGGDLTVTDAEVNVGGNVDVGGDLTVTDAEVNVGGDLDVGGNVNAKDSEINVNGKTVVEGDVVLDNSKINSEDITVKGTTETKNGSEIKGKVKFEGTLSFNLDGEDKKNGYVFLSVNETADLSKVTEVRLIQTDDYYKLNKGETMTLITKAANYKGESKIEERGINGEENYKYIYSVGIENSALMLGYVAKGAADQTKSFSEARLGASAALNSGSDLVAGQAIDSASAGESWEAFAAVGGSRSRYETGSHVDLNSTNVAAGLSKKVKDNVTLGIFVEGGNGRYTTYNEFETGTVRADGDINYFGGGVFAKVEGKKTAKGQLHGEASFRAGHMTSDYNSETFNPGESTRFDTSNAYMGAHAAVGYKWNVKDGGNVDTYVKYLWNRQNGDSPTIKDEQFDLDAINSHRVRAGFRYNSKENEKGVKVFGGLAYEYEFDGVAKGHMGEYAILEPDFKGGSGIAEVGIKYDKKGSPWKVELGLTGATGKRDSIGANLNAWYEFGNGGKKAKPAKPAKPAKKAESQAAESTPVQTAGTRDFEDLFGNRRAEVKPAKAEPATEAKKAKVQEQRKTEKVNRPVKPDTKNGEILGLGILDSSMLISK